MTTYQRFSDQQLREFQLRHACCDFCGSHDDVRPVQKHRMDDWAEDWLCKNCRTSTKEEATR